MILIAEATAELTIPGGGYTVATIMSLLVGAMIWYMRHTTIKTIPSLAKDHRDMTVMLIDNFRGDIAAEREARESGRDKDREAFRDGIHAIRSEQSRRLQD